MFVFILKQDPWAALQKNPSANSKKQFFKTCQSVALIPPAQARPYHIWLKEKAPPA